MKTLKTRKPLIILNEYGKRLPPKYMKLARKYADKRRTKPCDLSVAFFWIDTPEGYAFWRNVDHGKSPKIPREKTTPTKAPKKALGKKPLVLTDSIGEELKEPYKSLALKYTDKRLAGEHSLAENRVFIWRDTPEGHIFWMNVADGKSPKIPGEKTTRG